MAEFKANHYNEITFDKQEQQEFSELLLNCTAMSDRQRRAQVLQLLPQRIRFDIPESDTPSVQIREIVQTCQRYKAGLKELLSALHRIEGETLDWQRLEEFISRFRKPEATGTLPLTSAPLLGPAPTNPPNHTLDYANSSRRQNYPGRPQRPRLGVMLVVAIITTLLLFLKGSTDGIGMLENTLASRAIVDSDALVTSSPTSTNTSATTATTQAATTTAATRSVNTDATTATTQAIISNTFSSTSTPTVLAQTTNAIPTLATPASTITGRSPTPGAVTSALKLVYFSQVFPGHSDEINSLAFSPDGKTLATASHDRTVKLWDSASRQLKYTLKSHTDWVTSVAFSPDGQFLASVSVNNTARLWEASTGKEILPALEGGDQWHSTTALAFSPNSKILAIRYGDKSIRLWDVTTHKEISTWTAHSDWVRSLAFSPDGKILASASEDKAIKLWDTVTHKELASLSGQNGIITAITFSPNGKILASASEDGTVWLWDTGNFDKLDILSTYNSGWVTSVAFSLDSKILATGNEDKTVKLWKKDNFDNFQLESTLQGHSGWVQGVAFSPDKSTQTLASVSTDYSIKLWNVAANKLIDTIDGHRERIISFALSPDGKTLARGVPDAYSVKLWDIDKKQDDGSLKAHTDLVTALAFSPDQKLLASGSEDKTIILWDIATRTKLATLTDHTQTITALAFSPDNSLLASGSEDKTIILWDVAKREKLATLDSHKNTITSLTFSPDGKTLVSGSGSPSRDGNRTIKLWDVTNHKEKDNSEQDSVVTALAYNQDGTVLASGVVNGNITLTGSIAGEPSFTKYIQSFKQRWGLLGLAFSPAGKLLASASSDNTIKLWKVNSGPLVFSTKTDEDFSNTNTIVISNDDAFGVSGIVFTPDGKYLISLHIDGTIKLWELV